MRSINILLIFLIPVLGLVAGLSLAATISLFFLANLYSIKDKLFLHYNQNKLEIALLILLFISCFWAVNTVSSLSSFVKVLAIAILSYSLYSNTSKLGSISQFEPFLISSLLAALCIFYIEFLNDGIISRTFRVLFQKPTSHYFYLYLLDRGCIFIAMFSWLVIAILTKYNKYLLATVLYVIVAITLGVSDSLSGFVGFIASAPVFILTKYTILRKPSILSVLMVIASIAMISFANMMNPFHLSDKANFLPNSAKHRLFIWSYVADKSSQKLISGWGHGSSRNFSVKDEEIPVYKEVAYFPLPLHPHNNILQILFENGVIGLVVYLTILSKYLFYIGRNGNSKNSATVNIISSAYSCFTVFFVTSMISYNMWQSWWVCSMLWTAIMFSWLMSGKK